MIGQNLDRNRKQLHLFAKELQSRRVAPRHQNQNFGRVNLAHEIGHLRNRSEIAALLQRRIAGLAQYKAANFAGSHHREKIFVFKGSSSAGSPSSTVLRRPSRRAIALATTCFATTRPPIRPIGAIAMNRRKDPRKRDSDLEQERKKREQQDRCQPADQDVHDLDARLCDPLKIVIAPPALAGDMDEARNQAKRKIGAEVRNGVLNRYDSRSRRRGSPAR